MVVIAIFGNSLIGDSLIVAFTGNAITSCMQPPPILEYAKVLNDTYQKQPVTDPNHWLQVVMPFINLTLTEGKMPEERTIRRSIEGQLHGRYRLGLDEVVNSVKKGSKILMEGRPGVGKTTVLRHIAKQWAEGKFLKTFQIFILIPLGHIPSSIRISNLESLLEYHSHDYPDTASVARELGRTGGEGICFLLDALDEYSPQTPTHSDYIYQLIRGGRLPNAALMVTSRPSASHSLQQSFTRKIEVVGFLQHQIQQYINALPDNSAATISEYINRYKNLRHISYLPLHLAMMTYLAVHSEKVSLLDLDTETRIYRMFVNLTFLQIHKDEENLDEVHSQAFSALGKTAFDATTRSSDSDHDTSLRLDLLDPKLRGRVESFSILTISKQHEGDKVGEIFTFSHYTFQEFFAAYYLTTLPHEEQMQALKIYRCTCPLMWRFFFGILRAHSSKNTTKVFETFAHIHKSLHNIHDKDYNLVLMCAYELKQTAIAEVLVQELNHSIEGSCNHPSECAAFGYALSLNPHQFSKMEIIRFEDYYWEACFVSMFAELPESNGIVQVTLGQLVISDRTISALAQFVRYFPNLRQLEMLYIYNPLTGLTGVTPDHNTLSYKEIDKFASELEQLKHLRLIKSSTFYNPLSREMTRFVATVLKHLTTLQYLEYHEYGGVQWNGVELTKGIKHLTSLETLNLSGNRIGYDGIVALTDCIKSLTSLKELDLFDNEIGGGSAAKLVEGIKYLTSLETLNLGRNKIGKDGAVALTGGIKNLTSLKELVLENSAIGDKGAAKLVQGIKHLNSLETLNLARNEIGYDGVVALAGGIKNLTSLKRLDLSFNRIGGGSAAKLVEGIKHLTSLETINLAGNIIGIDGIVALTGGIKSLTSLKTLDLSRSDMGDRGAAKLAEGMKNVTSLETLNLAGNRIGDDGVAALAGCIKSLTSLKTLDLSHNKIGDSGAAKLAESIEHFNSLETLNLASNKMKSCTSNWRSQEY